MKPLVHLLAFTATFTLVALPANAHHGVASVGFSEPEGPGAALETTAALPLPQKSVFAMVKGEFVSFQKRSDRAAFPQQKNFASFNMVALGFGLTPWLSAYLFQPYNVKSLDGGPGRNAGLGDTQLMLSLGFKWDEGLRLIPQKESLDELMDWHWLFWLACTTPSGPTERNDESGERFAPDMQTGFGKPSPSAGFAVLKQLTSNVTVLGEMNYQHFLKHGYSRTDYQFGAETRLNAAASYRIYAKGQMRVDGIAEVIGLNLQRDREDEDRGGPLTMPALEASGGSMVYGSLGARVFLGKVVIGLGIRRTLWKDLNEASEQQGSEGLENFRISLSLSTSSPL